MQPRVLLAVVAAVALVAGARGARAECAAAICNAAKDAPCTSSVGETTRKRCGEFPGQALACARQGQGADEKCIDFAPLAGSITPLGLGDTCHSESSGGGSSTRSCGGSDSATLYCDAEDTFKCQKRLAIGQPCVVTDSRLAQPCAIGAYCKPAAGASLGGANRNGTCAAVEAIGAACPDQDRACVHGGNDFQPEIVKCYAGTCGYVARVAANGTCNADRDCVDGHFCDRRGGSVCVPGDASTCDPSVSSMNCVCSDDGSLKHQLYARATPAGASSTTIDSPLADRVKASLYYREGFDCHAATVAAEVAKIEKLLNAGDGGGGDGKTPGGDAKCTAHKLCEPCRAASGCAWCTNIAGLLSHCEDSCVFPSEPATVCDKTSGAARAAATALALLVAAVAALA